MSDPSSAFLLAPGGRRPPRTRACGLLRGFSGAIGPVQPFDYPYALEGRNAAGPAAQAHRRASSGPGRARARHDGPIVLAGKSMGGRVGCHVALVDAVQAVICSATRYAAQETARNFAIRYSSKLKTPILFVQGTRDPLVRSTFSRRAQAMPARSRLHIVEGGDHSLMVGKAALKGLRSSQEEVDDGVMTAIARFLKDELRG